ncbi:MAG: response regulator [Nitrospirales bacterium]
MKTLYSPEQILIVDDEQSILDAMAEAIRMMDYSVITAHNADEAWKKFEEEKPDVVVTDVRMPHRDGLSLTAQIKAVHPFCPVIVVTGFGSEQAAVAALKAGASDYLVKPFEFSGLRQAVERACSFNREKWGEECVVPVVVDVQSTITIDNFPEMLGGVVNMALRTLTSCLSDKQLLGIRVALQELLINAIEHGNLNISPQEKNKALIEDTYDYLLESRREMPEFSQRRVQLSLSHNVKNGMVEFRIVDEGEGFDWETILERDVNQLPQKAGSGRGIFLVRTLIPDVRYHGSGNEVSLTLSHDNVSQ